MSAAGGRADAIADAPLLPLVTHSDILHFARQAVVQLAERSADDPSGKSSSGNGVTQNIGALASCRMHAPSMSITGFPASFRGAQ
jgi:hypothetical protein